MDYSKTVNLLQTPFPMKADLPKREPGLLAYWEDHKIHEKIEEAGRGKPVFLLHDGPPYANGLIHMGHALNKILKDFVVKYKTLSGYHSPYRPGWDCHGLPIEHQLFKELGKNKHQITRVELRQKATEYALGFVDKQRKDFKRLGVLGDWDNPYLTLTNRYEASIVQVFFELQKKGLIYRKRKPGYWCAYDETALAEAEVEYSDKSSDSVFVRFRIKPESIPAAAKQQLVGKNLFILIWTTTPWTLPANVGLAFHPDEKYVLLKTPQGSLIVAEKLKDSVAKKIEVTAEVEGPALKGADYLGLLALNPLYDRESRVVNASYVTMSEGTGIVHIAPGHGLEDYEVGLAYGLEVLSPVDERGIFDATVGHPALQGKHVLKEANKAVMEVLGENLLFTEKIQHSYPHCWRCKNPIIFRSTKQWFLKVSEESRARLLSEIDKVTWVPSYGVHRIKGMVESRPDWCLSRQRHWGAPIAVLYCRTCDEPIYDEKLNGRIVDLIENKGTNVWYETSEDDLAKELAVRCPTCKGTQVRREMDILDVWFDSGVSWFAVVEKDFSAIKPDRVMYLEGSDQHRGWFQTSLIPSVMLRDKAPYDVVLTHGFVVDGKGHKMSKSLGNVMAPQEIIQKYGADILRLWVAASDYRDDVRLSQDILNHVIDMYRKFRNTFRFLLQNTSDFNYQRDKVSFGKMEEIDRWILAHFEEVKARVKKAYDDNEFHVVLSELNRFAAVPLSGFYFDALKDRLYCEHPSSHLRRSTQTALYELARGLSVLMAPLLSFTCEEAYLELRKISDTNLKESVLLDSLSSLAVVPTDELLLEKYSLVLAVRGLVNDVLDQRRKEGVFKSSQEAELTMNIGKLDDVKKDFLLHSKDDWALLLQMAEVTIIDKNSSAEAIDIKATTNKKCSRCWRFRSEVGKNIEHPELCGRCALAIKQSALNSL